MKKIKGFEPCKGRRKYMEKVKSNTKNLFNMLIEQTTNDWTELCTNCSTLIKEAQMSNKDIDDIVERVKKKNG